MVVIAPAVTVWTVEPVLVLVAKSPIAVPPKTEGLWKMAMTLFLPTGMMVVVNVTVPTPLLVPVSLA